MKHIEMLQQDTGMEGRFLKRIDKTGECWIWKGHITPRGYGQIKTKRYNGLRYSIVASRYMLFLKTGVLEKGLFCCHKCDNPKCVNPEHLFWGSSLVNQLDCINKGRRKVPYKDYTEARKIRNELRDTKNYKEIDEVGRRYGLSSSSARGIKYGTKWSYILDE